MTDHDRPDTPATVAQSLDDLWDGRLALEAADPDAAEMARPHQTTYFTPYWVRVGLAEARRGAARGRHEGAGAGTYPFACDGSGAGWKVEVDVGRPAVLWSDRGRRYLHLGQLQETSFYVPTGTKELHYFWSGGPHKVLDPDRKTIAEVTASDEVVTVRGAVRGRRPRGGLGRRPPAALGGRRETGPRAWRPWTHSPGNFDRRLGSFGRASLTLLGRVRGRRPPG